MFLNFVSYPAVLCDISELVPAHILGASRTWSWGFARCSLSVFWLCLPGILYTVVCHRSHTLLWPLRLQTGKPEGTLGLWLVQGLVLGLRTCVCVGGAVFPSPSLGLLLLLFFPYEMIWKNVDLWGWSRGAGGRVFDRHVLI